MNLCYRDIHYVPALGQFLTEDEYQGNVEIPITLVKHIYVRNNPISFSDPDGRDIFNPHGNYCGPQKMGTTSEGVATARASTELDTACRRHDAAYATKDKVLSFNPQVTSAQVRTDASLVYFGYEHALESAVRFDLEGVVDGLSVAHAGAFIFLPFSISKSLIGGIGGFFEKLF